MNEQKILDILMQIQSNIISIKEELVEHKQLIIALNEKIDNVEKRLRQELKDTENRLRQEFKQELRTTETKLRQEIKETETKLRKEFKQEIRDAVVFIQKEENTNLTILQRGIEMLAEKVESRNQYQAI